MKRLALIAISLVAFVVLVAGGRASDGSSANGYEVRGIFDSGGFVVTDEEVRVAGANVGTVSEVDITEPEEIASLRGDGTAPGKAVIVMKIDDPAFQDFREDATCLIRPQSLLGERYIDCIPTLPRSSAAEPPPPLEVIPEGEPGEGQHLLPLESNGKQVDLDLLQNISREPSADQFRLILNELGAGLAARGDDLAAIIERGNPALRQTDRVLAILAKQNRGLAQLAKDSDTILAPLARERTELAGFINRAGATAEATAERRSDLEAGLQKFPGALEELRTTMVELENFAEQGTPLAADLRVAAPGLTGASRELGPFSKNATSALTSLGDAAEASTPDLVASIPVIKDVRELANAAKPGAKSLEKLLRTFRERDGIDYLTRFIVKSSGTFNGFDDIGHYLRGTLLVTNCVDYLSLPLSGCGANFVGGAPGSTGPARVPSRRELLKLLGADTSKKKSQRGGKGSSASSGNGTNAIGDALAEAADQDESTDSPVEPTPEADPAEPEQDAAPTATERRSANRSTRNLLDYLFGS